MKPHRWKTKRLTPYTDKGIQRVACARCGKPSSAQWNICAIGPQFLPMCKACDIDINRLVLQWIKHPDATKLLAQYKGAQRG